VGIILKEVLKMDCCFTDTETIASAWLVSTYFGIFKEEIEKERGN
jgi:hypothetical protein